MMTFTQALEELLGGTISSATATIDGKKIEMRLDEERSLLIQGDDKNFLKTVVAHHHMEARWESENDSTEGSGEGERPSSPPPKPEPSPPRVV